MPDAVSNVSTPIVGAITSDIKPTTEAAKDLGKDTFLKLLVAQMKYQNPMAPTDGSQFLAQTAQFSMVERLEELSKSQSELLTTQRSAAATGMIGQSIVAAGKEGADITGIVTGMRITAEGPVLKIGNAEVAYTDVKEVQKA